jgi:hypothetical protein
MMPAVVRRFIRLAVAAVVLALLVAGCGTGPAKSAFVAGSPTGSPTASAVTASPPTETGPTSTPTPTP